MKFVKGMVMGTIISAGVIWMCTEDYSQNKKKLMKKGKKILKEMGM